MSEIIPPLDLSVVAQAPAWDRIADDYAEFITAHFERYSADALKLAKIVPGEQVLDVATGPGTLARLAARMTSVKALDFSSAMLEALQKLATPQELAQLELQQGDGQALPYDDKSFDAAFSMFGLFMFPDRAQGFAELHRVIKPGGRVVVASWQPQDDIRPFMIINTVLMEAIENPSDGMPLTDPQELRNELETANFTQVEVHPVTYILDSPSTETMWKGLERAHVALGIARDQLPPSTYEQLAIRIRQQLEAELGSGPQQLVMPAWLALGRVVAV